ncbi:hypothetical protein ACLOJK_020962 [Asimina triloba]
MVDAVVSFCVEKLKEQMAAEMDLLSGKTDDVAWIKDELESMKAFLADADRRRDRDAGVEAWVTQVRRLVFHAEDAIDEFMIQIDKHDRLKNQSMGFVGFYASYSKRILAQHRFGTEMQSIRCQVKEIHERRGRYRLQSLRRPRLALLDPGAAAPYVEEADIVRLEKDAMKIQQQLLKVNENAERAVISIVGTGGLGKTSLAKRAYEDIQIHFEIQAWVFVSQIFQTKEMLKNMLKGFF